MPIYEFMCNACEHHFEMLCAAATRAEELKCPSCGAQRVGKKLSMFAVSVGGGPDEMAATMSSGIPATQGGGGCGSCGGGSCGSCSH